MHSFLMYLFLCLYVFRAASAHHQEGKIVLIQFGPPDDEHLLLETCKGIKINTLRKSASSWSLPRIEWYCISALLYALIVWKGPTVPAPRSGESITSHKMVKLC
jgi:hypothetical protein